MSDTFCLFCDGCSGQDIGVSMILFKGILVNYLPVWMEKMLV
jgi:hypothetical protein